LKLKGKGCVFAPELREKAKELIGRYPVPRSALLPLLHLVQVQDGYVTEDGIAECAQLLGLTKAEVQAVSTFYTMYKRAPLGRHLVSVCTNFSCKVRGAQEVYDRLCERLGIGHNQTTPDGAIMLEHAECLGNCEGAPVVTVDYLNYECMTPEQAVELVERIIAGEIPPPTRGFTPPGVREISYRLACLGPRHPEEPGVMPHQARAADGAPPSFDAGPGIAPTYLDVRRGRPDVEARREEMRRAGQEPGELKEEAGGMGREFPSDKEPTGNA
jgi:NADH-quinone oxidoreductase subunit E